MKKVSLEDITIALLWIVFGVFIIKLLNLFSVYYPVSLDSKENMFWLFSASAQSVATFVAFLIAGYTLYTSSMDSLVDKEDSLIDIVAEERKTIFGRLKLLTIITGLAIIMNLLMLFKNGSEFNFRTNMIFLTMALTFISVAFGLRIVVYMIDPRRAEKTANKLVVSEVDFDQEGDLTGEQEFFSIYRRFEKEITNFIEYSGLLGKNNSIYNHVKVLRVLFDYGLISKAEYNDLNELRKYRNLLFHGNIENASKKMVYQAEMARSLMLEIKIRFSEGDFLNNDGRIRHYPKAT